MGWCEESKLWRGKDHVGALWLMVAEQTLTGQSAFLLARGAANWKKEKPHFVFHVFCIFPLNNKVLCGLLEGKQVLAGGKDSVGALWAAGMKTTLPRLLGPRLCVREIWIILKRLFGYVLRARLSNLQCSKTAFFLKRGATEWTKRVTDYRVFHGFYIYHWMTKCSVCCWEADKLWRGK